MFDSEDRLFIVMELVPAPCPSALPVLPGLERNEVLPRAAWGVGGK